MSKYCVIGRHGLIGSALAERLGNDVASFPTKDTRILFDFGSYRHPDFEQSPEWLMDQVFQQFSRELRFCGDHDILLVYPSSALVYEKETQFSRFKMTLESMAACYKTRSLGLRIFPVYGPTESGTVISQFCRGMRDGHQPVVYGDGTQTRDFIFIDDVVSQIMYLTTACKWTSGVFDVGTGVATSFNEIVRLINLALGTDIKPQYVARPSSYSEGIVSQRPRAHRVSVAVGISKILQLNRLEAPYVADTFAQPPTHAYDEWHTPSCYSCGQPLFSDRAHVCPGGPPFKTVTA